MECHRHLSFDSVTSPSHFSSKKNLLPSQLTWSQPLLLWGTHLLKVVFQPRSASDNLIATFRLCLSVCFFCWWRIASNTWVAWIQGSTDTSTSLTYPCSTNVGYDKMLFGQVSKMPKFVSKFSICFTRRWCRHPRTHLGRVKSLRTYFVTWSESKFSRCSVHERSCCDCWFVSLWY